MSLTHAALLLLTGTILAFTVCMKLIVEAFLKRLADQAAMTTKAMEHAAKAISLNSKILEAFTALVAQGIEQGSSKPEVAGSIPAERTT